MLHQPIMSQATSPNSLSTLLRRTQFGLMLLVLVVAASSILRGADGIADFYFFKQDMPLLIAASVALMALSRFQWGTDAPPLAWRGPQILGTCAGAAAIAYASTWLVLERYAQSRDETTAVFAADTMQAGHFGMAIPDAVRPFAQAAMPLSTGRWVGSGYWVSDYLPVNSAIRAIVGLLGDPWLTGSILLVVALAATWSSARRLWPDQREAAVIATMLAATSAQVILNAASPYATTAHFALNAVWLSCFLRGGRLGHGLALFIGLLATGLHQFQFHPLFLSGFVLWMWRSGRTRLAQLYAAAAIVNVAVWIVGYQHLLLPALFGTAARMPVAEATALPMIQAALGKFALLLRLEPLQSIGRFVAWQNILLVPLAWIGVTTARRRPGEPLPITFAFAVSCGIGLLLMPWQGLGFGYRYLHHLMPCILLLAAAGAVRLREQGCPVPRNLLIASVAVAATITLPFAAWRSHALLAPYAAAERLVRQAAADFVVVDSLGGVFLQDIVRVQDPRRRPLLLDLETMSMEQVRAVCRRGRVMLLDAQQAAALGMLQSQSPTETASQIRRKRAILARPGCARPVPMPG